jgi:protein phosphatase
MTEQQRITISLFAQTDVGKVRQNNEDNFVIADLTQHTYRTATDDGRLGESVVTFGVGEKGLIAAVSDGMGGALAGEVASHLAVNAVRVLMLKFQSLPEYAQLSFGEQFRLAIEQTNKLIHNQSLASPQFAGMGATFTGLAFHQQQVYVAQVGDSRAYVIRGNHIVQATKDQSLVGQLVDAGYLTEEQAQEHVYKNVILQALGAQPDTVVVLDRLNVYQNDVILLCSDGLSNKVQGSTIADVVASAADLKQACQRLIELANERGGEDNITVVLCQFAGEDLPPPMGPITFDIDRIERDEALPLDLILGLLDPHTLTAQALENSDHPPLHLDTDSGASIAEAEVDERIIEMPDSSAADSRPEQESRSLERNIGRILIGLLIIIFLGAALAVAWYLRIWRDRDERPRQASPPMTMGPHSSRPIPMPARGCLSQHTSWLMLGSSSQPTSKLAYSLDRCRS